MNKNAPNPMNNQKAVELIELLFFGYRDFVAEPDAILEEYGFGRAHHRVLHFVNRNPGLTVAELLDILKITKQSLSRVLRQLVEEGFIVQKTGSTDRRQRNLFVSPKGSRLANELLRRQIDRVQKAHHAALQDVKAAGGATFLRGLIDDAESAKVLDRISKAAVPSDT